MKEFIDIIKSDKKSKMLFIITIGVLFICTISYSLSIFSNNKQGKAANIKVNGLSFNMTTNTGESDDRILKLKANTLESFNVTLTNLNTMDVKYEIIYEVCTDSNCNNKIDKLPNGVSVGINNDSVGKITDLIEKDNNRIILLMTNNTSSDDYYIKLNLNAGYSWNELALINQIDIFSGIQNNIDFIAYVDGVEQSNFPNSCDYTYTYKTYKNGVKTTDSEVTLTCTNNTWNINVTNIPNKVKVWFTKIKIQGVNLKEYLIVLDKSSNGLKEDTTADKNLRYVGASPKNYITYNNETWRIIGIVDGYVKIIRNDSIGGYEWDSSGVNDWTTASLQTYLNGDYYNSLSDIAKNQIQERTWNLGGWNTSEVNAADMYTYERGTTVFPGNPTTWQGKIALMYPSDWGYASDTEACISNLYDCSTENAPANNWLNKSILEDPKILREWTLTHSKANGKITFFVEGCDFISQLLEVYYKMSVRPCLYLKSNISRVQGDGSASNPYQIELPS